MFLCRLALPLLLAATSLLPAGPTLAACEDWSAGPPVAPYVSFSGATFHNLPGGVLRDGFLLKQQITWSGLFYSLDTYLFDVRQPDQPREVRHWTESGGPFEDPTEFEIEDVDGARCVIGVFGYGGYGRRLVSSSPAGNTDVLLTPYRGKVSLWGDRAFQLSDDGMFSPFGVACLDVSTPATPVLLGVLPEDLLNLLALSEDLVLVRARNGQLKIVDFSTPAAPVLRGTADTPFTRWLGFAGGRVVISTGTATIGLDVSDPDAPYVAWTVPGDATAMALEGDLMALGFAGTGATLALFDNAGGAPLALGGAFGSEPSASIRLVLADGVLYTGGITAYDVSDPAFPQWLGQSPVSCNQGLSSSTVMLDGERLVTQHGLISSYCALASPAPLPGAGAAPLVTAQPNPFNPLTTISFTTAQDGLVAVTIHDARGRLVRALADRTMAAGPQAIAWDGRGDDGQAAAAGVYLVRVVSGGGVGTVKVVLAK